MFESYLFKNLSALAKAASIISVFPSVFIGASVVNATEIIDIPSITADRIIRDTRSGEVLSADWIQLSPDGLRARQAGSGAKFEYLQNFTLQKLWMLDWSRKILHEIGSVEVMPEGTTVDGRSFEPYIATIDEKPQSSIMAAEPCIDLVAIEVGLATWREQPVRVWRCEYAGGEHFSELFYSELWDLVVREERSDQTTIELSNIKFAEFSLDNFVPPIYFRKTDFRELIIGSPEIGNYSEQLPLE